MACAERSESIVYSIEALCQHKLDLPVFTLWLGHILES